MNWPLAACTKPSGNMIKLQEPRYRLSWWAAPRDFFSLTVESPPSAAHPCANPSGLPIHLPASVSRHPPIPTDVLSVLRIHRTTPEHAALADHATHAA